MPSRSALSGAPRRLPDTLSQLMRPALPHLGAVAAGLLLFGASESSAKPDGGHGSLKFAQPQSALEEGRIHSQESKTPATVHFVNLTAKDLQLYWLDFKGVRRSYGVLPAHGTVAKATYLTHVWLVTTPHGHGLAVVRPVGKDSTVLIDPMVAPKPPTDDGWTKSKGGGAVASLHFVNPTARPVQLYWLDFKGIRQPRGTIAANSELTQSTFVGHAWLVADPGGKEQAIFVAKEGAQSALIAPASADVP